MTQRYLGLRLSRRAVAGVLVDGDTLEYADGQHVSSNHERALRASLRYLDKLLNFTHPTVLVVDAPVSRPGSTAAQIRDELRKRAVERELRWISVPTTDLLNAFALRPLRNRKEVRELIRHYWTWTPDRGRVEPYILDAAATALHGEISHTLQEAGL